MTSRWSTTNRVDGAALTASAEASALPASNVQTKSVSKVWRIPAATGYVDMDLGASYGLDVMSFIQPNAGLLMASTDIVRWTAGTSAGLSNVYDSGNINAGVVERLGYHVHRPASTVTTRHLRLTVTAAALSVIDIGRIWAGADYVFSDGIEEGFEQDWQEAALPVAVGETSFVQYGFQGAHSRRYSGRLPVMSEADYSEILDVQRRLGTVGQLLFTLLNDSQPATTILARMTSIRPVRHIITGRMYSHDIELQEQR